MSGIEPLIAAEAAAATTTAATAAESIAAATAAAEAAAAADAMATASTLATEGPLQAAINESIMQGNLLDSANLYSQMGMTDPMQHFLKYGAEADMPGATMRSIQAGLQNAPLNTIANLPQYMGAPAMQGGNMALQAAKLAATPNQGQRTAYSPPQLNRGRQVTLAEPVQSLLQSQPMRRRKDMLSLI